MPLSDDERRCVLSACRWLDENLGGRWEVVQGNTLDDLNPHEPSPEVMVTNGLTSAAIEVTELRGGSVWNEHGASLRSLRTVLQPSVPGAFMLIPSDDFRLPISKPAVRRLKDQIEAAASRLKDGEEEVVVRVTRSARASMAYGDGPGHVYCCHGPNDVLRQASGMVSGAFMLVDPNQWEHSFETEEGRALAACAIADACRRRAAGAVVDAEWDEEWKLILLDPEGSGVDILCSTAAVSIPGAVTEDVQSALEKKHVKFAERRWGDVHVLVLDARFSLAQDYAPMAMSYVPDDQLEHLDLVLLVHDETAQAIWRRSPPS